MFNLFLLITETAISADKMLVKSSFTFKVVAGQDFRWEIECFYGNQTTKLLEPLSSSSQSTPKLMKKRFGFIRSAISLDQETLQIENSAGVCIRLLKDRFSPLLDCEDNNFKKTLLALKEKDIEVLSNSLNAIILKFHGEEYKRTDSEVNSELDPNCDKSSLQTCSTVGSSASSVVKQEIRFEGDASYSDDDGSGSRLSQSLSVSLLEGTSQSQETEEEQTRSKNLNLAEQVYDGDEEEVEENKATDMVTTIESIISKAECRAVKCSNIIVPTQLKVDQNLVMELKHLLQRTPDKTQMFLGTIRHIDKSGNPVGPHEVWVNPELFLALSELNDELGDVGPSKRVYAVIHEVFENDEISSLAVGLFLNNNSKEFAAKLHSKMTYNDLVRLSVSVISEENSERTKSFLRSTFNSFSKGRKNSGFFLKFASLPAVYLQMFEEFLRLYEEGSIHGQGIPLRRLIRADGKKKDDGRLEIPIKLLKDHLKVDPRNRHHLLEQLLAKKMTFKDYRLQLVKSTKMSMVKSKVEQISGQPFSALKESCPGLLTDQVLEDFEDAKQDKSGPNDIYKKLVSHMQVVMGKTNVVLTESVVNFINTEEINLTSVSRSIKGFDALILNYSDSKEFNTLYEFAIKEEVRRNQTAIAVLINDDEKLMLSEKSANYEDEEPDLIMELIYVRREKSIILNGFKKDYFPIAILGHRESLKNKVIKTFHPTPVKEALSHILSDCVVTCNKVVYAFNDTKNAFDLDPFSSLAKKKIVVSYHGRKVDIDALKEVIERKVN